MWILTSSEKLVCLFLPRTLCVFSGGVMDIFGSRLLRLVFRSWPSSGTAAALLRTLICFFQISSHSWNPVFVVVLRFNKVRHQDSSINLYTPVGVLQEQVPAGKHWFRLTIRPTVFHTSIDPLSGQCIPSLSPF